ncbi:MAG: hypothetical protein O7D91_17045 [Planctomycetota bacterium]|nr:hypothetical protein [Planctomycetota bacterium]
MKDNVIILLADQAVTAAVVRDARGGAAVLRHHRATMEEPLGSLDTVSMADLSAAITGAVEGAGGLQHPATLIIPQRWCYAHPVDPIKTGSRERSLAYRLEEYLPQALEELTCTFLKNGSQQVLGLAVRSKPLAELLGRLGAGQVFVQSLTVDLLCAVVQAQSEPLDTGRAGSTCGVLLRDHHHCSFALMRNGSDPPAIVRTVAVDGPPGAACSELARQTQLTESSLDLQTTRWHIVDTSRPADREGLILAAAHNTGLVPNLARGALAPRSRLERTNRLLLVLGAAAALLLGSVLAAQALEHRRYSAALRQVQAQQRQLYREVFPSGTVPISPALLVASQRKRLEGITLQDRKQSDPAPPDPLRPLTLLRGLAEGLAKDVRVKLVEFSVDEHHISLRGQTLHHRDAERIAEAVQQIEGVTSRPPGTSRLDNGAVEFSIRATVDEPTSPPGDDHGTVEG